MSDIDSIPLWAHKLLQNLSDENIRLQQKLDELKNSTATKILEFKKLKETQEKEQNDYLQKERDRVNKIIKEKIDQVTLVSLNYNKAFESRMQEINSLENLRHESYKIKLNTIQKIEKLERELNSLKKNDEEFIETPNSKIEIEEEKNSDLEWEDEVALPFLFPSKPVLKWTLPTTDTEKGLDSNNITYKKASQSEVMLLVRNEKKEAFLEIILHPSQFVLKSLINYLIEEDIDSEYTTEMSTKLEITNSIQNLMSFYGQELDFIKHLLVSEIKKASKFSEILSPNSITSQSICNYSTKIGSSYLKDVIKYHILKIIKQNKVYEFRQQKISKTESVETNVKTIKSLIFEFLTIICDSINKLPVQIIEICNFIQNEIIKKFPNQSIVSTILFPLFISFTIENPVESNIGISEVNNKIQELLKLIGRTLSNTANNTPFFEEDLLQFNDFISNHFGILKKFLIQISKTPLRDVWVNLPSLSLDEYTNQLYTNTKKLSLLNFEKISKTINSLDNETIYISEINYTDHDRLKIIVNFLLLQNQQKIQKENIFVQDLFDFLFDEKEILIDSIGMITTLKGLNINQISIDLINTNLFLDPSAKKAILLVKSLLRKEFSGLKNTGESFKFLSGFNVSIYTEFCNIIAKDFIEEIMPNLLNKKGKYPKLDKKGVLHLTNFIDVIIHAIPKLPNEIWEISNFLFRQPHDFGPMLFISNFVCNALNKIYNTSQIAENKKEKLLQKLKNIKLFLSHVAHGTSLTKTEVKNCSDINPLIQESHISLIKAMEKWVNYKSNESDHSDENNQKNYSFSWEVIRPALWRIFNIINNQELFEIILTKKNTLKIGYTMGELFFASLTS